MAINIDEKINIQIKPLVDRLREMNFLLMALVVVLFVGFSGCFIAATAMLVDSFNSKSASYQELTAQVITSEQKTDQITQYIKNCNAKKTSGC
jgi:hypothetical protein